MKRDVWMGTERIVVEELDVDAVHESTIDKPDRRRLRSAGVDVAAVPGVDEGLADHNVFARAGWRFLPKQVTLRSIGVGAAGASRCPVYLLESGEIFIGVPRAVSRLQDDLTGDEAEAALAGFGVRKIRQLRFAPNLFQVELPAGRDPLEVLDLMNDSPLAVYSQPEWLQQIDQRAADPELYKQWHLANTGQGGGHAGSDIGAEQAWTLSTGLGTTLAVIDLGFHLNDHDLEAAVGSLAAAFRPTDDGDAEYVGGRGAIPENAHGTFCAGMALARRDNGYLGSGVAPDAELLPIACLWSECGFQTTLARAIAYAAVPSSETDIRGKGADVISVSLGVGSTMAPVLRDALTFARTQGRGGLGMPVFWAVANRRTSVSDDGVCRSGLAIPVGATDCRDLAWTHAEGRELAFVAPGVEVYGPLGGERLYPSSGTSYAAPCAAAVAALVLATDPSMRADEVASILQSTCDKVPTDRKGRVLVPYDDRGRGRNDRYGHGRINAYRALRAVQLAASRVSAGER